MKSFANGNYDYLPGIPFLSFGTRAHPGYEIVRVDVRTPVPAYDALDIISPFLAARGRPLTTLCGVEFRQYAEGPMTRDEFSAFNQSYVGQLQEAGLTQSGDVPVARTNVVIAQPGDRGVLLNAFSFTIPTGHAGGRDFILSAIPEVIFSKEGEQVVESGGSGQEVFGRKLDYILNVAGQRIAEIGADWGEVTAVQLYAADAMPQPADPALGRQFGLPRSCGITWVDAVPPIGPAAVELDLRRTSQELVLRYR